MNLANRIQRLRKARGISQEELAEGLGVSRQAVSKWESEQSMPELDKAIQLSEFFGVTTDFLLKGVEREDSPEKKGERAGLFVLTATALHVIGLTVSAAIWYEKQTAAAVAVCAVFMALGCMVFGIGMYGAASKSKPRAKRNFWTVNIWLLLFTPCSLLYNFLFGGIGAPYPLLWRPWQAFPIFWLVYIGSCLTFLFLQRRFDR
ncbi:MAG: helix-turn-helix transcriptional regulator [Clostridiales bacterium]|nr:helix-turn-helix transcriptional regulator [Clostridiales bacterium]